MSNSQQSTVNSQQSTVNSQNSQQSTVNSQQSTVNSQQSTVNSQHFIDFIFYIYLNIINSKKFISWGDCDVF